MEGKLEGGRRKLGIAEETHGSQLQEVSMGLGGGGEWGNCLCVNQKVLLSIGNPVRVTLAFFSLDWLADRGILAGLLRGLGCKFDRKIGHHFASFWDLCFSWAAVALAFEDSGFYRS